MGRRVRGLTGRVFYLGNIDELPHNEDWIKMLSRDVGVDGKEIPNRFDREAGLRNETFTPLRDLEKREREE